MSSTAQPLIDFHTHAFPDAIAGRTLDKLSVISNIIPHSQGTLAGTRKRQKQAGVTLSVVLQIATKPSQQTTVNNWAAENQKDGLVFFGSVHPDAEDAVSELKRIKALGLKGVKLHPDYQEFFVEEKRMFPLYEAMEALGLPLIFHAGQDPLSPELIHAEPQQIALVAKTFPHLTLIAAHMGGVNRSNEVEKHLVGLPNVYLDTSMAHTFCDPAQGERIIKTHGSDHVLFGSDLPWGSAEKSLAFLEQLHLSPEDKERVFYKNACKLLKLE